MYKSEFIEKVIKAYLAAKSPLLDITTVMISPRRRNLTSLQMINLMKFYQSTGMLPCRTPKGIQFTYASEEKLKGTTPDYLNILYGGLDPDMPFKKENLHEAWEAAKPKMSALVAGADIMGKIIVFGTAGETRSGSYYKEIWDAAVNHQVPQLAPQEYFLMHSGYSNERS